MISLTTTGRDSMTSNCPRLKSRAPPSPGTLGKNFLLNAFGKLSSAGKTEAVKRVEELAHVPWFAADEHKDAARMDDLINGITAILKKNRPDATREIAAFTQYALNKYEKT